MASAKTNIEIKTTFNQLMSISDMRLSTFVTVLCSLFIAACGSTSSNAPSATAVVADLKQGAWQQQLTLKEFEERYLENNRSVESAQRDSLGAYKEFLNRYIDFKLKVKDAYDKGFGNDPDVARELKQYRDQLAQPYLIEKEVFDAAIRDLYERRKVEIDASHILTFAAPEAAPADTLKAYNKLLEALKEIQAGASFDSVALKYSEDPSVKQNNGRLGYFTGGMMVYQFEDGAYATKLGGVSPIVRTRFGYHLIKVWNKRERMPDIRAAHILCAFKSPTDTAGAYEKITAIANALKQGGDFAKLAADSSDDTGSAQRGGDLGFFGTGRMVKPFEDAAFALKNIGDISPIVRTQFGYHLIKLIERKKPGTLDSEREELKSLIKRNTEKFNAEQNKLAAKLKATNNYTESASALALLFSKMDTSSATPLATLELGSAKDSVAFSFAARRYTLDSLAAFLKTVAQSEKLTLERLKYFRDLYAQRELIEYEMSQLETRYPEFKKLMQDYKDGILLFTVSERTVWSKSMPNDSMAQAFYDAHRDDFKFGERIEISQITVPTKQMAEKLRAELSEKKRELDIVTAADVKKKQAEIRAVLKKLKRRAPDYKAQKDSLDAALLAVKVDTEPRSFDELAKRYSETSDAKVGLFQRGENTFADLVFGSDIGTISAPIGMDEKYHLVRVDRREPPRPKTFEEAKAEAYSRYQEQRNRELEDEWLKTLRAKTEIRLYESVLMNAFRGRAMPAVSTMSN